jgi:hypothetical protein
MKTELDVLLRRGDPAPDVPAYGHARARQLLDRAVEAGAAHPAPSAGRRRPVSLFAAAAGVVGLAAAIAAGVVVVPVIGDRGRVGLSIAAAETLHQLAAEAGNQPTDLARIGQFRYVKIAETHTMETSDGTAASAPSYSEEWIAADGTVWSRKTGPSGQVDRARFAPETGSGQGTYSRAYLAGLPADPEQLYKRLRKDATGSSSEDEAVFVAVGDMLRTQVAAPVLRAAAINALGFLPVDITRGARTTTGAEGVLISMERPNQKGTEALLVDEHGSAVIEERHTHRYDQPATPLTSRSVASTSTVLISHIVDSLPADLQDL